MPDAPFEQCVFINCPFDEAFEPILQGMLFCVVYLGFEPRIATERNDSGEYRLQKIVSLIKSSKYSIHDLSRSQAAERGAFARMNMPFELGIDYGCRQLSRGARRTKKLLILDEQRYRYQRVLSDLAGCDIGAHEGRFEVAIRRVRNWLVTEAALTAEGPKRILDAYEDFQEWHYERQLAAGFSDEDIQDYATAELLAAMKQWVAVGKPI